MDKGWVKLQREVIESGILANDNTALVVYIHLLALADWRTGSYRSGRKKLATICNLQQGSLRGAISRLETNQLIATKSTSKYTTFFICNFQEANQHFEENQPGDDKKSATRTRIRKKKNINSEAEEETIDEKLLNLLNKKTKRNFRILPRGYKETLKKFSLEEISEALDALVEDDWHSKKIHELKSDYLLRASTIDSMLSKRKKQTEDMADLDELFGDGKWMKTL